VDLVVACEVLYYMKNIPAALNRISQLGRACFATYHDGRSKLLDPHFSSISNRQKSTFRFGDSCWRAVWWYGPWGNRSHTLTALAVSLA
jgi:hypothetical protein